MSPLFLRGSPRTTNHTFGDRVTVPDQRGQPVLVTPAACPVLTVGPTDRYGSAKPKDGICLLKK